MDSTSWLALATVVAAVLGLVGGFLGTRRQRREIREVHEQITHGFAEEVLSQLGEVSGKVDAVRVQVGIVKRRLDTHINQHATGAFANRQKR